VFRFASHRFAALQGRRPFDKGVLLSLKCDGSGCRSRTMLWWRTMRRKSQSSARIRTRRWPMRLNRMSHQLLGSAALIAVLVACAAPPCSSLVARARRVTAMPPRATGARPRAEVPRAWGARSAVAGRIQRRLGVARPALKRAAVDWGMLAATLLRQYKDTVKNDVPGNAATINDNLASCPLAPAFRALNQRRGRGDHSLGLVSPTERLYEEMTMNQRSGSPPRVSTTKPQALATARPAPIPAASTPPPTLVQTVISRQ